MLDMKKFNLRKMRMVLSPHAHGWQIKIALVVGVMLLVSELLMASEPTAQPFTVEPIVISVEPVKLSAVEVLGDIKNKIREDFKIPEDLKQRVAFWFDIYSKYTGTQHVFHSENYPWIVYSVVDVQPILAGPENKWVKFHKAEAAVRTERTRIRKILVALSKKNNYDNLKPEEQVIFDLMKDVEGKRRKVFREAAHNFRAQLGQKDFMLGGLKSSAKYLPDMEKIFSDKDLPIELTRLPLVESSFNEAAVSKVGASGVWQLMPYIGKHMLYVDSNIDERNSPLKATTAAARLLKQNYQILKTWPLALTAYNHGPGGVIRASKKTKSTDLSDILDNRTHYFGFASSNFFCSFLAALYVEKYQEEIFGSFEKSSLVPVVTITLKKSIRIKEIATRTGISVDELHSYNLDIRKNVIEKNRKLPKGYKLIIPQDRAEKLEALANQNQKKLTQI